MNVREGGRPPDGGAHPRAIHDGVGVPRGDSEEAEDYGLQLMKHPRYIAVHIVLPAPAGVPPVSPEVSLYLNDRREIGFEGYGVGGTTVKVFTLTVGGQ